MFKRPPRIVVLNTASNTPKVSELDKCITGWETYRAALVSQKLELEKDIDKTVFTISSGAIGISLAVLDKIAPPAKYSFFYIALGIGWSLLIISLLYQVLSYVGTAKKIKVSISRTDDIISSQTLEEVGPKEDDFRAFWTNQNNIIDRDNKISFGMMLSGIFFVLLFAFFGFIAKEDKTIQEVNVTLSDSTIKKYILMSKEKNNQGSSSKDSSSLKGSSGSQRTPEGRRQQNTTRIEGRKQEILPPPPPRGKGK